MGPVFQEAVEPLLLVQSKLSPRRFVQEQKPPSKVQLLMIGAGVVGGGVGGTAMDGTTEQRVVANVTSSIAMSPLTLLPRTASNTTCRLNRTAVVVSGIQAIFHYVSHPV